jgi:hypothetical protein
VRATRRRRRFAARRCIARRSGTPADRRQQRTGWFAAGREFQQAMRLLSDSAFKLYVWLCLNADRRVGAIRVESGKLAPVLGVESRWIDAAVAGLRERSVCRTDGRQIGIEDRFWPYQKQHQVAIDEADYVRAVRTLFTARACVRSVFTAADERIAMELYRRGTTLEAIRHAVSLGCARRYIALLNGQIAGPVTSLRYFAVIVDEVTQEGVPNGYWEHVQRRADQLERQWLQSRTAASAKCPASPEPRPASPE